MRVSTSEFQQATTNTILDQQAQLLKTQNQLGTGRRILTPSDDPAGATRALDIDSAVKSTEQYQRNNEQAELRLKQEDSILDQVSNITNRIRELTVQAANGTQTENSRASIAAELRERREELVDLANAKDGRGEYLFSGLKTDTQPFVSEGGGVAYQGDQGQRDIQVGPTRKVDSSHNGFETFMDIPTGNGEFRVVPDEANQGSARLAGESTNPQADFDGPYQIRFVDNGSGDLEVEVEDGGGNVSTSPYEPGEEITFDGRTVTFEGTPEFGDSFTVEEADSRSIFGTVDNIIESLETRGDNNADRARLATESYQALEDLDAAIDAFSETRAETGARMNALESEYQANETAKLDLKTELSRVEDLDYAEAISRLNQQSVGLQAAQKSYAQVQNLSLFQYI
ncbi:flagellar hook-associated protein FlgL [Aquisalimonas lutea]|uniref:flagellar hook-associated protein FlgL n=1 Tax=Aquisalimonas lutea TaxID=1327750 RepID=UPI0025B31152|nr:flagellar hook-associated protein FlgL [Aquisalimonas lutea]MDN3517991.1 flagellar hook-associated protein FlgL [Aquisalimonas lutea]